MRGGLLAALLSLGLAAWAVSTAGGHPGSAPSGAARLGDPTGGGGVGAGPLRPRSPEQAGTAAGGLPQTPTQDRTRQGGQSGPIPAEAAAAGGSQTNGQTSHQRAQQPQSQPQYQWTAATKHKQRPEAPGQQHTPDPSPHTRGNRDSSHGRALPSTTTPRADGHPKPHRSHHMGSPCAAKPATTSAPRNSRVTTAAANSATVGRTTATTTRPTTISGSHPLQAHGSIPPGVPTGTQRGEHPPAAAHYTFGDGPYERRGQPSTNSHKHNNLCHSSPLRHRRPPGLGPYVTPPPTIPTRTPGTMTSTTHSRSSNPPG